MNIVSLKSGFSSKLLTLIVLFVLLVTSFPIAVVSAEGMDSATTSSTDDSDSEVVHDVVTDTPTDVVDDVTLEVGGGESGNATSTVVFDDGDKETEIIAEPTYAISGHKYECLYNSEEEGWNCDTPVEGWDMYATDGRTMYETKTDANGEYSFEVTGGDWQISESEYAFWFQYATWQDGRSIESYTCDFTFGDEENIPTFARTVADDADGYCDFGNIHEVYPIYGYKVNDDNANGQEDEGEVGVAGWTITAINQDGEVATTTTDEDGEYLFLVEPGDWTISEEVRTGWTQTNVLQDDESADGAECTFPISGIVVGRSSLRALEEDSESSSYVPTCVFLNHENPAPTTYLVIGMKWNDLNGNAYKDENEGALAGWTIIATNENGESDFSTTTVTDENGNYEFNLEAGIWKITEENRAGWTQIAVTYNDEVGTGEGAQSCDFTLGNREARGGSEHDCVFYNQAVPETPVATTTPSTPSSRGGSSSGTRLRAATPTGLVLGASTTVPACGMYLTDYMRKGAAASSTQVTKLQVFLNAVGIKSPLTGEFDEATDAAVRAFQLQYKPEVLTPWYLAKIVPHENPTGWVYQLTRWKINNIVCPGSEAYPTLN